MKRQDSGAVLRLVRVFGVFLALLLLFWRSLPASAGGAPSCAVGSFARVVEPMQSAAGLRQGPVVPVDQGAWVNSASDDADDGAELVARSPARLSGFAASPPTNAGFVAVFEKRARPSHAPSLERPPRVVVA